MWHVFWLWLMLKLISSWNAVATVINTGIFIDLIETAGINCRPFICYLMKFILLGFSCLKIIHFYNGSMKSILIKVLSSCCNLIHWWKIWIQSNRSPVRSMHGLYFDSTFVLVWNYYSSLFFFLLFFTVLI